MMPLADHVGGTTLDRPYASGTFSVADDGTVAFTLTGTDGPPTWRFVGLGTRKLDA